MIILVILAFAAFVGGIGFVIGRATGLEEANIGLMERDVAYHNALLALEQILCDQLDRDEVPEAAETEWVIKLLKGAEL